jgi:hypothetical protein
MKEERAAEEERTASESADNSAPVLRPFQVRSSCQYPGQCRIRFRRLCPDQRLLFRVRRFPRRCPIREHPKAARQEQPAAVSASSPEVEPASEVLQVSEAGQRVPLHREPENEAARIAVAVPTRAHRIRSCLLRRLLVLVRRHPLQALP